MEQPKHVVIISGSSRGIGKFLAGHFLSEGYVVHGCSRGSSAITHENYFHETLDIADENKVTSWVRKIGRSGNGVRILICNAGSVQVQSLLMGTSGKQNNEITSTNISGTFYLCREVAKIMVRQKFGRIVTFSSIAAAFHDRGSALYAASKKAVEEMTKVLSKELAPYNIYCNCIAPGYVETPAVEGLGNDFREQVISRQIINRPLHYEEIAYAVDFLISEKNTFVSGQVISLGFVC